MRDDCNLTFKKATFWSEARSNSDIIQKHYDWVVVGSNSDMDFFTNCVLIDRVDFHINMKASRAWAPRGQMANAIIPTIKTPTHTIIGAILSIHVVNLSIRVPKQQPKARKIKSGKKRKNPPESASREEGSKRHNCWSLFKILKWDFGYYGQARSNRRLLSGYGQRAGLVV